MKKKEINFLCVVDIFNEGIDIPEIDTVLFLRPTESLTVYLQQLGRGLRLADDKECLTVLDFVNQANENYNFAEKFRALVGKTTTKIKDEIEHNFPHLPSGCTIRMDEQSQEYILDNIRVQVFNAKRLRREISLFTHQVANKELTIHNFTTHHNLDLRVLYTQKNSWEILKEPRNMYEKEISTTELYILRALRRITHVDVMEYLNFMSDLIAADFESTQVPLSNVYLLTFYYDIWQKKVSDHGFKSIEEAIATLNTYPRFKQELQELLFALKERVDHIVQPLEDSRVPGLFVHGHYSREQLKSLVGLNKPEKASSWREGVQDLVEQNAMLMMVTLNKSDKHFSATTSYEDYAISDTLFHWQSQNKTKPGTERGQKFINQKVDGRDMLLFVRDSNKDAFGLTDTYWFLGRVEYKGHRGSQPMSIEWVLENPLPPGVWQSAGKMAVG